MSKTKQFFCFILAAIAGSFMTLGFAPYDYWYVPIISVAITMLLTNNMNPNASARTWFGFGLSYFGVGINWIHVSIVTYGDLPILGTIGLMSLLSAYLALYPATVGWIIAKFPKSLWRSIFLFPAIWTLMELARGYLLTGFPWLWVGYVHTNSPFAPIASYIGVIGLSFLTIMVAGALSKINNWLYTVYLFIAIAILFYLTLIYNPILKTNKTINLALIQGNIPQSIKWEPTQLGPTLQKYFRLTDKHNEKSDIIIWPEGAIPIEETAVHNYLSEINIYANKVDAALITGILSSKNSNFYNSLIVLGNYNKKRQPSGDYIPYNSNQYNKHHLLPIGEFVPFGDLLRPIAPIFDLPQSSFARGDRVQKNLRAGGFNIAPAICYEIAFPEQLRDNVHADTDFILTVSNDAWFGNSIGPLQHMQIAQMRAIEFGRPVVRVTNNGVTATVNPSGKVTASLPQFTAGVLNTKIDIVRGETIFSRFGHMPIYIILSLIILISLLNRNKKEIDPKELIFN